MTTEPRWIEQPLPGLGDAPLITAKLILHFNGPSGRVEVWRSLENTETGQMLYCEGGEAVPLELATQLGLDKLRSLLLAVREVLLPF